MRLPILKEFEVNNIEAFVEFWSQFYNYPNMHLYECVNNEFFTEQNIIDLYTWKNGMPLSAPKLASVHEKVIEKLDIINDLKVADGNINLDWFFTEFGNLRVVWRVFLLHCIKPNKYSIYDQHIHRTFQFIHDLPYTHIDVSIAEGIKLEFYRTQYLPFVEQLNLENLKLMDDAYFVFGQFLKTRNYSMFF